MMRWLSLSVLTGAAAVTLFTALAASASTDAMRLVGTTGPGQTITLKKGGRDVIYLKPGRYAITIRDRSKKHGFVLSAQAQATGAIFRTSLRFVGRKAGTVTLKPGLYYYSCPAHGIYEMSGSFRVQS